MREIVFTHSGNLGDILFSLHFIRDYIEWKGADRALMLLTYGKPAVYGERHPARRRTMLSGSAASEVLPCSLRASAFISSTSA